MSLERLQKIIANAGIASRRKVEELITQGRVTLNGQVVTELGTKADGTRDHIKVDGKLLRGAQEHVYLLMNKPRGYVTTVSDPEGRPTVMSLVKNVGERIYPVGRLDYTSEGLLLLTNDGDLAHKLTKTASHVPKTYMVKISGRASEAEIEKLRQGVKIGGRLGRKAMRPVRTAPAQIRLVREAENPWYEVTLIEGRNRQIRRMFEEIGHHVEKIKRVRYGPLALDVEPGEVRELTPREVDSLRHFDASRAVTVRPISASRADARRAGIIPARTRRVDLRRSGARPADTRRPDTRATDSRPTDKRPAAVRRPEGRPVAQPSNDQFGNRSENRSDNRRADSRRTGGRFEDTRRKDTRQADARPADSSRTDTRPAGKPARKQWKPRTRGNTR